MANPFNAVPLDLRGFMDPIVAAATRTATFRDKELEEAKAAAARQQFGAALLGDAEPTRAQQLMSLGGAPAGPKLPAMVGGGGRMTMPVGARGGQFDQIAPRMMADLQKDFQLTPEQAAGFVGNLGHESAGFGTLQEIKPMVPGSRGGYGYAQWTGPRRRQFEQYVAQNGLDPDSYEANYGFLKHELTATPEGNVLASLKQAPDAQTAARVVQDQFLRPGIPGTGSRMAWTDRALRVAGSNPQGAGPSSADMPAPGAQTVQQGFHTPGTVPQAPAPAPLSAGPAGGATISPQMRQALMAGLAHPATAAAAMAQIAELKKQGYDFQVVGENLVRTDKRRGTAEVVPGIGKPTAWQTFQTQDGKQVAWNPQTLDTKILDSGGSGWRPMTPEERTVYGVDAGTGGAIGPDGKPVALAGTANTKISLGETTAERARVGKEYGLTGDDLKAFVLNGKLPTASEKSPTEGQTNAAGFSTRMKSADETLNDPKVLRAMLDPKQVVASNVPVVGNYLLSDEYQKADQAQRNFVNAILRKESGAAIGESEFQNARKQYFPQPGDSVAVVQQKKANREEAIAGVSGAAGPTALGNVDRAKAGQPAIPEGAKKAADGNLYVPDPARPGKYLRVDP